MLRFSPDGAKIAVGDAGREIKVWEIGKPEPVITRKWMAHQSTVTTICWAPEAFSTSSGAKQCPFTQNSKDASLNDL